MNRNHRNGLIQSVIFFTVVWMAAQYVRGEIFKQLDGYFEGAGKVGGIVFALGLAFLKFYSWKRARDASGFARGLWNALPWFLGIAVPTFYVVFYFATNESVGVMDWISLITELVVPVSALIVAYVLLATNPTEPHDTGNFSSPLNTGQIEPLDVPGNRENPPPLL